MIMCIKGNVVAVQATCVNVFIRRLPGFLQFKHGCQRLWDIVQNHPDTCTELFVYDHKKLTFVDFHTLLGGPKLVRTNGCKKRT